MRLVSILAGLILLTAASSAVAADPSGEAGASPRLELSARSTVKALPDVAVVALGITSEAASAAEALSRCRAAVASTQTGVERVGVSHGAVHIEGLTINPQYIFHQGEKSTLAGYAASARLTVDVQDLSRLGAVLDAAAAGGASAVTDVRFGLARPDLADDAARREAVKSLMAKADLYAQALGMHVVRVVSLTDETDEPARRPVPGRIEAHFSPAPPPPLPEAAAVTVTAAVTGVFLLGK